ncbi:MAG: CPBP family intramembrane glutamic endopeptidase [Candidatus Acidiferrales bacterium]
MDTAAVALPKSGSYDRIASPWHTILLLVALAAWSAWGKFHADQMRAAANPGRLGLYAQTFAFEWILFAVMILGLRRHGSPFSSVLGERWKSLRQVLIDIGISAAFWVCSGFLLFLLSKLLHANGLGRNMQFMLPHGWLEIAVWVALSITAGICEEAIFRGYFQRQFISFTQNGPVGIALSAALFGAAHAYQGLRMVVLIALYGSMFGILAYWRKTVRPGMIAHAWQDSLSGIAASLVRH